MHHKMYTNLFVGLLCAAALSCARSSGPVTGAWSLPANGLQAALRVPSARVTTGTEVPILAVFRNRGSTPCRLPANPYYTIGQTHDGKGFSDAIGSAAIPQDEPELRPGEERVFRLTALRTDVNGPGIYGLSGRIGGMELSPVELRAR